MGFFHRAKEQVKKTARNLILMMIGAALGGITITGIGLYYFREPILKAIVIPRISKVTGFHTEVQHLRHEFPLRMTLSGVTMENPKGFKPKVFATSPYFYIDIDLAALLEGKVFYIREWNLIISNLNLSRSKDNVINGELLKAIKNFMNGRTPEDKMGGINTPPSSMDFQMDHLQLRIDKISYRDYTGVVRKSLKKLSLRAHAYDNTRYFGNLVDEIEEDVMNEMKLGKRVELSPFYFESSIKKAAHSVKGTTEKFAEGAGKMVKTTAVTGPTEILKTTAGIMGMMGEKEKKVEKEIPLQSASEKEIHEAVLESQLRAAQSASPGPSAAPSLAPSSSPAPSESPAPNPSPAAA